MSDTEVLKAQYESAIGAGAFYPATLLLFVDIPEGQFYLGNWEDSRLLHHEYLHFVQLSTTSYGANAFLRDLDLIALTISTVRRLVDAKQHISLPLDPPSASLPEDLAGEVRGVSELRQAIIEDLAILQGAYKFDPVLRQCTFRGKPVRSDANCMVLGFQDPSMIDENVPLGTRAVMEAAASTHESAYLELISTNQAALEALRAWTATKEANPVYWVANDLVRKALGDDSRYVLLALADLSLCGALEWQLQDWAQGVNTPLLHSPGVRFHAALNAAVGMPSISAVDFKTDYYSVIGDICKKLEWTPPWELGNGEFLRQLWDAIRSKELFVGYEGFEVVLSNGFAMRNQLSHICALPLAIPPRDSKGTVTIVESAIWPHPPPNLSLAAGKSAFHDFAQKAYGRWLQPGQDFRSVFQSSVVEYAMARRMQRMVWERPEGQPCLLEERSAAKPEPNCSLASAACADCPCRKFVRKTLGIDAAEIQWRSGNEPG